MLEVVLWHAASPRLATNAKERVRLFFMFCCLV